MSAVDQRVFIHWVNAEDCIVQVNQEWRDFALENHAAELGTEAVLGASLWNFISDLPTKAIYRTLLTKVRQTKQPVAVPFRCDAPDRRRFMQMTISQLSKDVVEFSSRIFHEERRESVRLMRHDTPRSQQAIVSCSWCKKIKLTPENWVEVEVAVAQLNLFDEAKLPEITHSICHPCREQMENAAGL